MLVLLIIAGFGFSHPVADDGNSLDKESWINRNLKEMTLEEKIGQMFMIRAHSDKGPEHISEVSKYIENYGVGGLCFFQGSPEKQAELINRYQKISRIPLMIAIDAEWGLGMRFPNDAISYPRQLMLGAIQDNNIIYEMGVEIGKELKRIGVHVNFAPVIDVNNNPGNPVINDRSFGEDLFNVISKGYAYMRGLQDAGIMACAKHFPGHGDTNIDSHVDLPVINYDKSRLDSLELAPFRMLSKQGIDGVMVAHLHIPALDDRPNRPTTLSGRVIKDLLRTEIGFQGIVFTDAMEMQGVSKHFANGEAELEALIAGNDFIVLPNDLPVAINKIKDAVESGLITEERIEQSVKRILEAKFNLGLYIDPYVHNTEKIGMDINSNKALALKSKLTELAITLVANEDHIIPVQKLSSTKFASLAIGADHPTPFQERLESYCGDIRHFQAPKELVTSKLLEIKKQCSDFDVIFISLHGMNKYASRNFGIHPSSVSLIRELASQKKIILTIFGSPYSLKFFPGIPNIITAYNEDNITQDLTAQSIFGAFEINGRLPVSASEEFNFGMGINTASLNRLGFSLPERVGMNSDSLSAIDTIVEEMIQEEAAPGCQILIAKDGKIVFQKSYGAHTYANNFKTKNEDVFDLASLTKILASTLSIMKLHEEKKLNIYSPIKKYITEADTSNKGELVIEDILSHHAGLKAWIPFYAETLDSTLKEPKPSHKYYKNSISDSFSILVANDLFLRKDYKDSIWALILASELRDKRNYLYSDLGFYMMAEVIERVSGKSIENYTKENFYIPLGLKTTGYKPLEYLEPERLVPTEDDSYFRNQILNGFVHDMGAAMLGGVGGHAGLFSNAYDLAILMQMLLNGGDYGGKVFLNPKTINIFTNRYYRSTRRGIGFDLKELNADKKLNMSEKASDRTFGHTGFTGTAAFADPNHNLIYIFLSNRTFPSMDNNLFSKNEYRPRVQTVIYNSLMD